MKVFSGTANEELAGKICEYLDTKLSDINISKFSDGEIKLVINENVIKNKLDKNTNNNVFIFSDQKLIS